MTVRQAVILAAATAVATVGCSIQTPPRDDGRAEVECEANASCRMVFFAFTGFRGERAELYIDEELAYAGVLTTADWSTGSSYTARLQVSDGARLRLIVDGVTIYDQPLTGDGVKTIYLSPSSVQQTDHPGPLLD
ncbi:MAG: hypothetical protein V7672_05905 [Brevundimonas sp.]|uniref:hypothetical protein n=1 Tax=Brevundimonas sp. TaxID=1871086 RepID=UPI00300147D6